MTNKETLTRCPWSGDNPLYIDYHDKEWGVPLHDNNKLFELLCLEGAQAGLNWLTVLKKRRGYQQAFKNFKPEIVATFKEKDMLKLLTNSEIIRNKLKIFSVVENAKAILRIQTEFGSFDKYIWQFVGGKPIIHNFSQLGGLPSQDEIAISMSSDLKKRGFSFVGPTICYAFMQATGIVNDHLISCYRYKQLQAT
ncbi:MAG TPA: DNA-3-methyladenine glycosylase I [Candidatus Saccharimonadales bacterium]|nr:DNA-3-methyladenine glycosylase I [Candidatus Saccharimonadales bacterium]